VYYEGFVADAIDRFSREHGGLLTGDDLARWRAALERYGRSAGTADSTGAAGIAALAAIDRARSHPDQPLTAHRGRLIRDAHGVHLDLCDPPIEVTGAGADSLATADGADVWLQGRCRGPDRLEWVGGRVVGRPRVDLFVMGFCPYARRLEKQMAADLAKLPPGKTPEIAVHYLLYWDDDGPVRHVGSTHGERERTEDAVQIRIRDDHPRAFWRYLALRAESESPWEVLAQQAGLGWSDIAAIQRRVARDTDAMLETEHTWNTSNFPHVPGSPTVFWRGAVARSIADVPGFTAPPNEHEQCAEGAGDK